MPQLRELARKTVDLLVWLREDKFFLLLIPEWSIGEAGLATVITPAIVSDRQSPREVGDKRSCIDHLQGA